jgi:hypothetical protein
VKFKLEAANPIKKPTTRKKWAECGRLPDMHRFLRISKLWENSHNTLFWKANDVVHNFEFILFKKFHFSFDVFFKMRII